MRVRRADAGAALGLSSKSWSSARCPRTSDRRLALPIVTQTFSAPKRPLTLPVSHARPHSPPDTLYEGGFLRAVMSFPPDFPLRPPKMRFLTEMWHPNSTSSSSSSLSSCFCMSC